MARAHRQRRTRGERIAIVAAVIVAVGFPVWLFGGSYLRQREAALSRAKDAAIAGPPCPSLTKAEFAARHLKVKHATFYEDVTFGRQVGHMSCNSLRYGGGWGTDMYPVCQFTGPVAVTVKTDKGEWYFFPGAGQPATVSVPHGKASCVVASNFTIRKLIEP